MLIIGHDHQIVYDHALLLPVIMLIIRGGDVIVYGQNDAIVSALYG